jgi:arabinose-5-phosphate isomerase
MSNSISKSVAGPLVEDARAIIRSEASAIASVAERLDAVIAEAIALIESKTGPDLPGVLVVSGIGKSGLVGQRISASFASTGTPSHFLHPVEALHGDLGRVRPNDVALLLSYGGETDEITRLLDLLKRMAVPIIAITSRRTSTLGKNANLCIELGPIEEACPLRLAPTTSVNCISVVGDALVLAVMGLRKFSADDFAAFHPAGSLGRKLLRVNQAMTFRIGENFSAIADSYSVRDALAHDTTLSTARRAGTLLLTDASGKLSGVFTNGDLRRRLLSKPNFLDLPIADVMTRNPKRIGQDALASEALAMVKTHKILDLPVVDADDRPVGMIDAQDLVGLRIVE